MSLSRNATVLQLLFNRTNMLFDLGRVDDLRDMDRLLAGPMLAGAEFLLLARVALTERDGDPERAVVTMSPVSPS